jgi:hypothetical protein
LHQARYPLLAWSISNQPSFIPFLNCLPHRTDQTICFVQQNLTH